MSDPLVLPDKIPSSAVVDLSRLLTDASDPAEGIRIDATGVRMIGALAAEELSRFVQSARAREIHVEIAPSAAFEDDLRTLGLHDLLFKEGPDQ